MKTLEQIAQEAAVEIGELVHPAAELSGFRSIILTALQSLTQQHEAQVAALTKERDEARDSRISMLERDRNEWKERHDSVWRQGAEAAEQRDTAQSELATARAEISRLTTELREVKSYAGLTEDSAQTTLATEEQKQALIPLKVAALKTALRNRQVALENAECERDEARAQLREHIAESATEIARLETNLCNSGKLVESADAEIARLREDAHKVANLIVGNMNEVPNTNERCAFNLLHRMIQPKGGDAPCPSDPGSTHPEGSNAAPESNPPVAAHEQSEPVGQAAITQNVLIKSLLVAKAALENDRRFIQKHGSEDDSNLNHDALFHVEHCLKNLQK